MLFSMGTELIGSHNCTVKHLIWPADPIDFIQALCAFEERHVVARPAIRRYAGEATYECITNEVAYECVCPESAPGIMPFHVVHSLTLL